MKVRIQNIETTKFIIPQKDPQLSLIWDINLINK